MITTPSRRQMVPHSLRYSAIPAVLNRRYDLARLRPKLCRPPEGKRKTVAYARVSISGQKEDLERQKHVLELYCACQGWTFEVVADLGSGMNDHKGLKRLLNDILPTGSAGWL